MVNEGIDRAREWKQDCMWIVSDWPQISACICIWNELELVLCSIYDEVIHTTIFRRSDNNNNVYVCMCVCMCEYTHNMSLFKRFQDFIFSYFFYISIFVRQAIATAVCAAACRCMYDGPIRHIRHIRRNECKSNSEHLIHTTLEYIFIFFGDCSGHAIVLSKEIIIIIVENYCTFTLTLCSMRFSIRKYRLCIEVIKGGKSCFFHSSSSSSSFLSMALFGSTEHNATRKESVLLLFCIQF